MSGVIEMPVNARKKGTILLVLGILLTVASPSLPFFHMIVGLLYILGVALVFVGTLLINPAPKSVVINIFLAIIAIAIANVFSVWLHGNGWLPTWR